MDFLQSAGVPVLTEMGIAPNRERKNSIPTPLESTCKPTNGRYTYSSPNGVVAQLVRAPDCRSGGCGFEPRRPRLAKPLVSPVIPRVFSFSDRSTTRCQKCHKSTSVAPNWHFLAQPLVQRSNDRFQCPPLYACFLRPVIWRSFLSVPAVFKRSGTLAFRT